MRSFQELRVWYLPTLADAYRPETHHDDGTASFGFYATSPTWSRRLILLTTPNLVGPEQKSACQRLASFSGSFISDSSVSEDVTLLCDAVPQFSRCESGIKLYDGFRGSVAGHLERQFQRKGSSCRAKKTCLISRAR